MSAGADHDVTNALAVIADEIYGVDLNALPDTRQALFRQQIATTHGELLAAMMLADAAFQVAVELGQLAEVLALREGKAVPK